MNLRTNKIIEKARKDGWEISLYISYSDERMRNLKMWNPNGKLVFDSYVQYFDLANIIENHYNAFVKYDYDKRKLVEKWKPLLDNKSNLTKIPIIEGQEQWSMNKNNKIEITGSYNPPSSPVPPPRPSPHHKLDKNVPSSDESKNNSMINYKLIAERLWGILDDIDTAFDHYKPDMKDRFVNYVNEKSKERSLYANSLDGQTLTFNNNIPIIEDLDPMSKWFKDAWLIEKELKNKPEVDIPKIPVTEEENIEVKLHNTTDAQVWTDDFFKTFEKIYPDIFYYINSLLPKEGCESFKEWVFGWFCNAIQTGIDLTNNERDKRYIYILQSNSGDIVDIYNYEPSEQDINSSYKLRFNFPTGTPVDASKKCLLIRYNKHKGMQYWNGKAEPETKYNWKNV